MAADIPTTEPSSVRSGDTWAWTKTLDDYPAPTWTLTYTLVNLSSKITLTSTASGTDHAISVDKATTAAYSAGRYTWISHVDDGTSRYTVETGVIEVEPDLAVAGVTAYDARSNWVKLFDAMESALATFGSKAWTMGYALGDRNVTFRSHAEFLQLYDRARMEKQREEQADKLARGLGVGPKVMVRL